jgi:hypothetical protein
LIIPGCLRRGSQFFGTTAPNEANRGQAPVNRDWAIVPNLLSKDGFAAGRFVQSLIIGYGIVFIDSRDGQWDGLTAATASAGIRHRSPMRFFVPDRDGGLPYHGD